MRYLKGGLDQAQYTDEWVDPTDDRAKRNRDNDATCEFIRRRITTPGRLLDLGCGHGRMLSLLAMDKIRAMLAPGGMALLEMPNIEGVDTKLKR